jgi:DNA repair protein RAD50
VIQFCFPLTIIVGANGCGKTTIIEALKYSVTGSLPPGNKSGQAFVHDPKGIGRPTCKANIKLRFTNKAGSPMVVVRSMEVKQNKSSLSFKALDGVIRTTDENGDRITLSHKCTELDRTIPNLMGVSKPILEHVVFCHQEDASWPLMEGAVLKKRFDDIFDSTRYAKALEAIRKLRLKYAGTVKDHKADLAGLAAHQHAAKGFREDMETSREELERVDDSIAGAREEIEEQTEQAEKATKVLLEIEGIELESDGVQQQIDIAKATASSFLDACDEDLTQSNTEDKLKSLLHGFDKVILEDESQLKKDLHKQGDIQREIERLGDRKTDIHKDLAKFVAASEARESTLRERLSHAQEMGDKYVLDLDVSQTQSTYGGTLTGTMGTQQSPNSPGAATNMGGGGGRLSLGLSMISQETLITISADDLNLFLDAISKKRRELQTDKDEHRHRATEHEDEMQKALSDLTARQRTISAEREKLKAKIVEARHELQRVRSSSSSGQYKIRKSDIEESKRLATKAHKEAQSANSDPRMTVIPQEIRAHEHKITELKAQIDEDQRTLQELRGHADILRQVSISAINPHFSGPFCYQYFPTRIQAFQF